MAAFALRRAYLFGISLAFIACWAYCLTLASRQLFISTRESSATHSVSDFADMRVAQAIFCSYCLISAGGLLSFWIATRRRALLGYIPFGLSFVTASYCAVVPPQLPTVHLLAIEPVLICALFSLAASVCFAGHRLLPVRKRFEGPHPLCKRCGYDLWGIRSIRCPECGEQCIASGNCSEAIS